MIDLNALRLANRLLAAPGALNCPDKPPSRTVVTNDGGRDETLTGPDNRSCLQPAAQPGMERGKLCFAGRCDGAENRCLATAVDGCRIHVPRYQRLQPFCPRPPGRAAGVRRLAQVLFRPPPGTPR